MRLKFSSSHFARPEQGDGYGDEDGTVEEASRHRQPAVRQPAGPFLRTAETPTPHAERAGMCSTSGDHNHRRSHPSAETKGRGRPSAAAGEYSAGSGAEAFASGSANSRITRPRMSFSGPLSSQPVARTDQGGPSSGMCKALAGHSPPDAFRRPTPGYPEQGERSGWETQNTSPQRPKTPARPVRPAWQDTCTTGLRRVSGEEKEEGTQQGARLLPTPDRMPLPSTPQSRRQQYEQHQQSTRSQVSCVR